MEDGLEEVTVIEEVPQDNKEDEEVEEDPDQLEEERLVGNMELAEGWNEGKFEVNIIHCNDCYLHYHYSRHSEDEHVDKFNDLGDFIGMMFP